MPPASTLSQATSSVTRLLKDLESYDKELAEQKTSLEKLQADTTGGAEGDEDEAGNREYLVKQQVGEQQAIICLVMCPIFFVHRLIHDLEQLCLHVGIFHL